MEASTAASSINPGPESTHSSRDTSNPDSRPLVEQPGPCGHVENNNADFDAAIGTRTACVAAVSVGTITAMLCLASGIYIVRTQPDTLLARLPIPKKATEFLSLAINVMITLCIDGMMFVHSVSLRWALYYEQRLEYNTNIRLFRNAKRSRPNKWYSNLIALSCLILTYAASSVLLLPNGSGPTSCLLNHKVGAYPRDISGVALMALGLGLGGQAAIATWCLASGKRTIRTWSSNPLNNTLAAMQNGIIQHRPGRCMLSVHQRHQWSTKAVYPVQKQENMLDAQRRVRYVLLLLWSLAVIAIVWPIAVTAAAMGSEIPSDSANLRGLSCWGKMNIRWEPLGEHKELGTCTSNAAIVVLFGLEYSAQVVNCILFVCAVQGMQTIGLHCAELLVNLTRDEAAWRQAYIGMRRKGPGAQLSGSPFRTALFSRENIVLSVSKAVLHWAVGQGMVPTVYNTFQAYGSLAPADPKWCKEIYGNINFKAARTPMFEVMIYMVYPRLFIYAILAVVLAAFATWLAQRRPRGYQPATWGHLQTLADLIDDWRVDEKGRMWWGDKTGPLEANGEVDATRHAGTSRDKAMLAPICSESIYAGS